MGLVLANAGATPVAFDTEPPAFAVYLRKDDGWNKVADDAGANATGRTLAPGANATVVLAYGVFAEGAGGRDIGYGDPLEPHPWPAGTYRVCFSAHPGDDPAWVRACKDFRIR